MARNEDRREFLKRMGWSLASFPLLFMGGCKDDTVITANDNSKGEGSAKSRNQKDEIFSVIPSSGEKISPIGMGTWITFNVGNAPPLMDKRTQVLAEFFKEGGGMIDSSPMYGTAEQVLGYGLSKLKKGGSSPDLSTLFSATKVWTPMGQNGPQQMEKSEKLWKVKKFDLLQVHNLVDWKSHLKTLFKMKEKGEVRYVGITTSHGRRHGDMMRVMKSEPIDFVQLTYNIENRDVERDLLPLARKKKLAVIANRPFGGGSLVKGIQRKGVPLPPWAKEIDCANWPQFLLKFIISHPALTCAIPATTQVVHMRENKGAARGKLPDAKMRKKMIEYFEKHG